MSGARRSAEINRSRGGAHKAHQRRFDERSSEGQSEEPIERISSHPSSTKCDIQTHRAPTCASVQTHKRINGISRKFELSSRTFGNRLYVGGRLGHRKWRPTDANARLTGLVMSVMVASAGTADTPRSVGQFVPTTSCVHTQSTDMPRNHIRNTSPSRGRRGHTHAHDSKRLAFPQAIPL